MEDGGRERREVGGQMVDRRTERQMRKEGSAGGWRVGGWRRWLDGWMEGSGEGREKMVWDGGEGGRQRCSGGGAPRVPWPSAVPGEGPR